VWSQLRAPLTQMDAAVIWTMWQNRDSGNISPGGRKLLALMNAELKRNGYPKLSLQMLEDHLKTLHRMQCIKPNDSDPSKWWLCEWVKKTYT
jgi:hypothetical protein